MADAVTFSRAAQALVRRTFSASLMNEVANHPAVRPSLGGVGAIDLTAAISDPRNVCLIADGGGWLLEHYGDGRYEAHSQFLPDKRGPRVIAAMREGLRYMFAATDCLEIVTKVPADNPAADGLARAAGFREEFHRADAWPGGVAVSYRVLTLDRWRSTDLELVRLGEEFHDALENAKRAAGCPLPAHPADDAHDRAVGAAVAMVRAGNPRKAVWAYNRWGRLAGYAPIVLMTEHPAVFDVQDALVALAANGRMEVLECR